MNNKVGIETLKIRIRNLGTFRVTEQLYKDTKKDLIETKVD